MVNRELTPEQVRKAILTTFPEVTELEFEMVQ
jgi:hypothetical protein